MPILDLGLILLCCSVSLETNIYFFLLSSKMAIFAHGYFFNLATTKITKRADTS